MKHVRYQSIGNTVGIENTVDDFWEIADDGHVVRSVHLQPDGSLTKYDQEHDADRFGALPEGILTEEMLADSSLGKITFLSLDEFEAKWSLKAKNEPHAFKMHQPPESWSVECTPSGRDGFLFYHEGSQEIPFYWEYGGGDIIAIIRFTEPKEFNRRHPWAASQKEAILKRVAEELVRQQAPTGRAELDYATLTIFLREQPKP